jgi:hypothetical protein
MRILDQNDVELKESDIDYKKGYLISENIFIQHHEAVEAVAEQGHWETIAEYQNGGKDVDWIVDVEAVEAVEAWDEYENIMRYVLYTKEELKQRMPKASHNITAGECVTVDGVMYEATTNIPNCERIVIGQNAVVTTLEEQLYKLKFKGE